MTTNFHMCVDIEGVLCWKDSKLRKLFKNKDGSKPDAKELRKWLCSQRDKGKRVLPFGEPCDGFSYETGCPGHPVEEETK